MRKYNLELIKAKACEKHKRILELIDQLAQQNDRIDDAWTAPNQTVIDYTKQLEQKLGDELCCSIQSSDDLCELQEEHPYYQYDDEHSNCYFILDGIKIQVADLRSMRECKRVNKETYFDICVPVIDYMEDNMFIQHVIPDSWLYGSQSDEFKEYKPVHEEFINAARKYIQEHHITKEIQEYEDN